MIKGKGPCSVCTFKNSKIMAFFEIESTIFSLDVDKYEKGYDKWDQIKLNNYYIFPVNQVCIQYNEDEILLFGGFYNQSLQVNETRFIFDPKCIKLINFKDNIVKFIDMKTESIQSQKLKLLKDDFFYYNQVCKFNNKFYSLGKDHIHIIHDNLKEVECLHEEGDYPYYDSDD